MDQLGSYRLRKRLAVGGMGEVYLGEKIGPEGFVKPVVLKCVLPQLAKDRAFVQLFLDEARLAALLNHPNIAQVYDFGLVDDIYYIAMEYVPGYTVDDIRRKLRSINVSLPLEHVACIASQVCQGLHYAHTLTDANGVSLGLVHRDVSPHNLIVSIDGGVKLVDFGIAKARAGLTRVQAKGAVGKFGYMSPEQARGDQVDGRSDLFSLGVCLWELASNERLHDPKLDRAPDYDPRKPVRPLGEVRRDVPRQFEQILQTALAIQPDDRYPNAQEMHIALERFQAAMTHYAGQAALAKYIKDLVDGKVENPDESASGHVVEPARKAGATRPRATGGEALEGAQKYEEVFGVTMEAGRQRVRRPPPKSWETKQKPPAPEPERTPSAGQGGRMVELSKDGPELALALESPRTRATPPRAPTAAPSRRGRSWAWVVALLVLAGAAGAAFAFKDRLAGVVKDGRALIQRDPPKPEAKLSSIYRIETDPPGASVSLDEEPRPGVTPMDIELIPDVEYEIAVRLPRFATRRQRVKGQVKEEIQRLTFKLPPAGSLRVTTEPSGALVSIDGRVVPNQVTPLSLDDLPADQDVKVTAEIKGMRPVTKTVLVAAGKKKSLHIALDPDGE